MAQMVLEACPDKREDRITFVPYQLTPVCRQFYPQVLDLL